MKEEYLKHTDNQGRIEVNKDTKYWFKRDWETIKNSFRKTLVIIPFVFVILTTVLLIITQWELKTSLELSLIFTPIISLGFFMIKTLATKGYDIDHIQGTHVNK